MKTRKLLQPYTYLLCAGLAALGGPVLAMDPQPAPNAQPAAATQQVLATLAAAAEAAVAPPAQASSCSSSSTAAATPVDPERLPTFAPASSSKAPGYASMVGINLKRALHKQEAAKGLQAPELFSISAKAAKAPSDRVVAVGTHDPESKQHYLMIVDLDLLANARAESLVNYLAVPEAMDDTKWLSPTTLVCAAGKGKLRVYHYDSQNQQLAEAGAMVQGSGADLREIALNPNSPSVLAVGGYDHKLNIIDLNRPDAPFLQQVDLQGVIGSLRWSPANGGAYLSATLDEGKFYLFDARTQIKEASSNLNANQLGLYCHERIGEFGVALGFGNGEVKLFDLRKTNHMVQAFRDPMVDVVGGIEHEASAQQFLVSGYTDYSHWKRQPDDQVTVEPHGDLGSNPRRGKGWHCYSIFASPTEILTTTSEGELMVAYLEP